jgi:hypothetical protein
LVMRMTHSPNSASNNGYSDELLESKYICTRLGTHMSDQEIRNFARSIIRSSGGQCNSFILFDEMSTMGVTPDQLQRAINNDYEIEVSNGIAHLIEK